MKLSSLTIGSLKGALLVSLALVLVPAVVSAQTNGKSSGSAEQAVRQTLDELYAALARNDVAVLDRIYAGDYTLINESGELMTKAPRLAAIKSGEMKYESIAFDDYAVRVHGDTAVATYRVDYKAKMKGVDVGGKGRVTATLMKTGGRWRLVAAQATYIKEQ